MPTIDAEGLSVVAILRFSDIPFTLTSGASRSMTASNILPVVILEKEGEKRKCCPGLTVLVDYLSREDCFPNPNDLLTPFMLAESAAFVSLVQSKFGPTRLYELFQIPRNYADVYHTLLEKERPFPLNRILPFLRRAQVQQQLQNETPEALYENSGITLTSLSKRLGDSHKFFYGDEPTVLDAVVFGYLASVLYTPLASSQLRDQISQFQNLVDFVRNVSDGYFSGVDDGDDLLVDGQFDGDVLADQRMEDVLQDSRNVRQGGPSENLEAMTEEEKERRRWNGYFVWGSVAAFVAHILLGHEVDFASRLL